MLTNNNNNTEDKSTELEDEENPKFERVLDIDSPYQYMFRIVLLGDSNVGKTSLLTRFCDSTFKENYSNTIGVDFRVVTLKYQSITSKVHVWDTAGQERFKSIAVNYFRSSQGFIFVYDITNEDSFKNVESWAELAFSNSGGGIVNFLVGNKRDLEDKRKVTQAQAKEFAKKKGLYFFESSAKDNDNVEKIFVLFTYKLIKFFNKNKEQYNKDIKNGERLSLSSGNEVINTTRDDEKKGCGC